LGGQKYFFLKRKKNPFFKKKKKGPPQNPHRDDAITLVFKNKMTNLETVLMPPYDYRREVQGA